MTMSQSLQAVAHGPPTLQLVHVSVPVFAILSDYSQSLYASTIALALVHLGHLSLGHYYLSHPRLVQLSPLVHLIRGERLRGEMFVRFSVEWLTSLQAQLHFGFRVFDFPALRDHLDK